MKPSFAVFLCLLLSALFAASTDENRKFVIKRHGRGDMSVDINSPYMSVSMEEYEKNVAIQALSYSNTPIQAVPFTKPEQKTVALDNTDDLRTVLSTSLGPVSNIGESPQNYYIAYAAIDLMNYHYSKSRGGQWKFSVEELISALPEDKINDVNEVMHYLTCTGVRRMDSNDMQKYKIKTFSHYTKIEYYTNSFIATTIQTQPMFVVIGIHPMYFQFNTYSSDPIRAGFTRPSYGGVLTGFNMEDDGEEYWEMYIRRHDGVGNKVKLACVLEKNGVIQPPFAGLVSKMYTITIPDINEFTGHVDLSSVTSDNLASDKIEETILAATGVTSAADVTSIVLPVDTMDSSSIINLNAFTNLDTLILSGENTEILSSLVLPDNVDVIITGNTGSSRRLEESATPVTKELKFIEHNLRSLTIGNYLFNSDNYIVQIDRCPNLQYIMIGDNSFAKASSVKIVTNNLLHTISIGSNSFSGIETPENTVFTIKNLHLLEKLEFGADSMKNFDTVETTSIDNEVVNVYGSSAFSSLYVHIYEETVKTSVKEYFADKATAQTIPPADLIIASSEDDCNQITQNNWETIEVKNSLCNDLTIDWSVTNYPFLKSIKIGYDTLKNLKSFVVKNNRVLERIELVTAVNPISGNGQSPEGYASMKEVGSVVISENPLLSQVTLGNYAFCDTQSFELSNLPKLATMTIGYRVLEVCNVASFTGLDILETMNLGNNTFKNVNEFTLSDLPIKSLIIQNNTFHNTYIFTLNNLPNLETIDIKRFAFRSTSMVSFIDLPSLKTVTFGDNSFEASHILNIKNVPFTDGVFTPGADSFAALTRYGISIEDTTSNRLPACILETCDATLSDIPANGLVIKSEADCSKLTDNTLSYIIVAKGFCNNLTNPLVIDGYTNLKFFEVYFDSLRNVKSLTISDNDNLERFSTWRDNHNNYPVSTTDAPFINVEDVVIENNEKLTVIDFAPYSFANTTSLTLNNLPVEELQFGKHSFENTADLDLSDLDALTHFDIEGWSFNKMEVFSLPVPNLVSLNLGDYSLHKVSNFTLHDLTKLESLWIGSNVLYFNGVGATEMILSNLPSLTSIYVGDVSLKNVVTLDIYKLSALQSFTIDADVFANTITLNIAETPFTSGTYYECNSGFNALSKYKINAQTDSQRLAGCISAHGCDSDDIISFTIPLNTLAIFSDDDCDKLFDENAKQWGGIYVDAEKCNTYEREWIISNYPNLEMIEIGSKALQKITKLEISNNDKLKSFTVLDSTAGGALQKANLKITNNDALSIISIGDRGFRDGNTFEISGLSNLASLKFGNVVLSNYFKSKLTISGFDKLNEIFFGNSAFKKATEIELSNLDLLTKLTFTINPNSETTTITLNDLPSLSELQTLGENSYVFYNVNSLSITDVPFTNGVYTNNLTTKANAFPIIVSNKSATDNSEKQRLKRCIEAMGCTATEFQDIPTPTE